MTDNLRRERVRSTEAQLTGDVRWLVGGDSTSPVQDVEQGELLARIRNALTGVSPTERLAVQLRCIGLDRQEIGFILDLPSAKLHGVLRRAFDQLRRRLVIK
jgi:DNA-directed RNA polymerase specialized sigma24 family protein